MSPEIRWSAPYFDGYAVDLWALGPMLFIMTTGRALFEFADNANPTFQQITKRGGLADVVDNEGLSPELIDLLQQMMWLDPRRRLSLQQIREHPWMQGPMAPPPIE